MFLIIFSVLISILGLFSIKRKSYLSFFIPMILFLPDYYGIDIARGLPLITVSRILFVILYLYTIFLYRENIANTIKSLKVSLPMLLLGGYFLLRIITNLYYVRKYGSAINTIFSIIFEELLFIIAVLSMRLTKPKIISVIKAVVYSSVIISILGLFESYSSIRITDSLYTVNRYMLNVRYVRLGLLRATSTLGLPGVYGNLCVMLVPAIVFMFYHTLQKRYLIIASLNIMACIHSGTRSSLIFLLVVYALCFIPFILNGKVKKYLSALLVVSISVLSVIIILSVASKHMRYYYTTTGKALLNTVGFDFDLNEGAPNGVKGFGPNLDGNMSRIVQLSGIKYAASVNPLFGLGSKAQMRREVSYYYKGQWRFFSTYDIGYVQVFMDEGLIGSLGFVCLFAALFILASSKKAGKEKSFLIVSLISYLMCMLGTANIYYCLWTIAIVIIAVHRSVEEI